MCKQYHYHSECFTTNCHSILGSRKRNRYCREALKARRLGRCSTGVQIAGVFRVVESTACCEACKQQAKTNRQHEQQNEQQVLDQSSSSSSSSSSDQEKNANIEILGFVAMPKAKPKPPSQPPIPAQSEPLPKSKGKTKNSNQDLFDTVFAAALADMEIAFNNATSDTATTKPGTSDTNEEA
ncbi:hypothetical protein F5Y00DRAFT_167255 [Daldinia vernicosa]|uniref:uncharacterized protein n=1 Tax=Daldinia vernicosa TaxID=114800 RepID=UPI0020074228|nr:uncharacterized protein F5Y00DRAFT_167255 [Daldinia vernicosa]KAI0845543.1 hypothetical protein F5Y00DRAFT_167255 [Daldinia vernicosa]